MNSKQQAAKRLAPAKMLQAGRRLLHPGWTALMVRDHLFSLSSPGDSRAHLDAAIAWLCRAQDHGGGAGVAYGYSLLEGWMPPYPETTGYIIPTFFDYLRLNPSEDLRNRALRMADWEIDVQLPQGAVQAGPYRQNDSARAPAVFNTGQVILGWCRAYAETGDERYLQAAQRAGDWLVDVQDGDGAWRQESPRTETLVHAYDVRVAWSLLELHAQAPEPRYLQAARRNLDWTLAQQQPNGWFENNAFYVSSGRWNLPLTHTIAYVMEGLLESARILEDERCLQAVRKTALRLLRLFELRQFMPGDFDSEWKTSATYSCLTGDAQTAGVWLRLYEITQDTRFLNAALKLNDYVKSTQSLRSVHSGIRGGVKGSQPIQGRYTPFTFVNWGAKFLADSLMLEERIMAAFTAAVQRGEKLGPGDLKTAPERLQVV
ncbi:MAG TPA: beta-L-arabinofuranosidase domain-containing protein [Chthonomonadaceae bacterium]|nr:beta-L-arabinofuranosidase domain-containing protein [Chthonomonadaceae bacterium]